MNVSQRAAFYYSRRRRRLKNQATVVLLQPRSATLSSSASVDDARFMSGVTVLDNNEGESSISLSGSDAGSFQLTGNNLELKAGVVLSPGLLTVSVDASNAVKGDAHNVFTLTVT